MLSPRRIILLTPPRRARGQGMRRLYMLRRGCILRQASILPFDDPKHPPSTSGRTNLEAAPLHPLTGITRLPKYSGTARPRPTTRDTHPARTTRPAIPAECLRVRRLDRAASLRHIRGCQLGRWTWAEGPAQKMATPTVKSRREVPYQVLSIPNEQH